MTVGSSGAFPPPPDTASGRTADEPAPATPARAPARTAASSFTRTGAVWVATATALVLLILLIVFVLQNPTPVEVQFLWLAGTIPLGMALLVAAVVGGVVVAIAGVARVTQLRVGARRTRMHRRRRPGALRGE